MQVWEDRAGGIYLLSVRDESGKGRGSVSVRGYPGSRERERFRECKCGRIGLEGYI